MFTLLSKNGRFVKCAVLTVLRALCVHVAAYSRAIATERHVFGVVVSLTATSEGLERGLALFTIYVTVTSKQQRTYHGDRYENVVRGTVAVWRYVNESNIWHKTRLD